MSTCASCGKTGDLWKCGACQSVAYCGSECQRSHWRTHQRECQKKRQEMKDNLRKRPNRGESERSDRRWEIMKGGHRWQTMVNPFSECQVHISRRNSGRSNKKGILRQRGSRSRRTSRSERKKSVRWPKGLASKQEIQVAELCSMLAPNETVRDGLTRLNEAALKGDDKRERAARDRMNQIASELAAKGIHYIWRTPARLLEQLALDSMPDGTMDEDAVARSKSIVFDSKALNAFCGSDVAVSVRLEDKLSIAGVVSENSSMLRVIDDSGDATSHSDSVRTEVSDLAASAASASLEKRLNLAFTSPATTSLAAQGRSRPRCAPESSNPFSGSLSAEDKRNSHATLLRRRRELKAIRSKAERNSTNDAGSAREFKFKIKDLSRVIQVSGDDVDDPDVQPPSGVKRKRESHVYSASTNGSSSKADKKDDFSSKKARYHHHRVGPCRLDDTNGGTSRKWSGSPLLHA